MFDNYYNQTVVWKYRTLTKNIYGEYTYTTSSIKCRVTYKRKLIIKPNKEELVSTAIVHTTTAVKEGDKLTLGDLDWHVELIYPLVNLDGNIIGYKVVV